MIAVQLCQGQTYIQSAAEANQIDRSGFWLVTLGDSFASGEGNPNNIGAPFNDWKWLDDEKCHRSKHAWPYRVAEYYEDSDTHTREVFHSFLACSGASVNTGLLNEYTPNWFALNASPVTAQLDQLEQQINAAGRVPDVIFISAGGNDIGFGDIVKDCLWGGCPGGLANEDEVEDRLNDLPNRYDEVDRRLNDMGISSSRVYQMQYPSPLWGKKRKIWLVSWGPEKILAACWNASGRNAWRWAQNNVVIPLQNAVEAGTNRNGWNLIDGHLNSFVKHSYCPRNGLPGADSWWVGILSTIARQWGVGAFHPNKRGHKAIALRARSAIEDDVPTGWHLEEPTMDNEARRWAGTYNGRNDGRDAQLVITVNNTLGLLDITFRDLDRNVELTGTAAPRSVSNGGEGVHIIENMRLTNGGCTSWSPDNLDCIEKKIERLHLHGWADGHISGYSNWNGNNYGMAFSTSDVTSDLGDAGPLNRSAWLNAWTGTYSGRNDGRKAKLTIDRIGPVLNITFIDQDRNETFTGSKYIFFPHRPSPVHVLKNLHLTTATGKEKEIGRLMLHTWDTNYISGFTRWNNSTYGLYFMRE